MKLFNLVKGLSVILFLCCINLFSGTFKLQAQNTHGVMGYETQMSTINFMALPQSDPNQIITNRRTHINPRKKVEHEGDERGFHRSNSNIDVIHNGLQNNVQGHQIDHVQTVSPSPVITFNGITDNGQYIPPDTH